MMITITLTDDPIPPAHLSEGCVGASTPNDDGTIAIVIDKAWWCNATFEQRAELIVSLIGELGGT